MLFGAFTNASQAMQTMDWAMGSISQNIANVNTTGYKEKETLFKTVLSETHTSPPTSQNSPTKNTATTGLDIFGVRAVDRTMVSKSGTITASTTWSDMAINGRGFFIVTPPDSTGAPQTTLSSSNTLYTRAGDFTQRAVNGNNYFTTADGNFLMGWAADNLGVVSKTLSPVYANLGQKSDGMATTSIQLVANVPSNATMTGATKTFTDTTSVTDGFGTAQDLTMTWNRVSGDTWTVDFSLPANPASGSVGTITGSPVTVVMDASGNITSPTTSASGTGFADLTFDWSAGPTMQNTASINLTSNKPTVQGISETIAVYDGAFNSHNLTMNFEHASNGQWYMSFTPVAAEGAVSSLTADGTAYTNSIPITFDGAGNILTPATAELTVGWTAAGAGSNTITLDMRKLTQFSGETNNKLGVKVIDQNGYASGTMDKVEISTDGSVMAHYDNGESRRIFQIPVASFVAPDQLDAISGTLFRATEQAGDMTVASISDQGSGASIVASATESSNVALEDQFTRMIVTQKAYSVNSNVFKTADEMTQTIRDLIT
ncbi:flagellar hook-basal body complex protein [Paramagnetospirillum magneticum]|uniref:Flagellar hook protein FlgE n=1 Tax=Paramagnetospirillum magneticum (strain ATCC 700264 / AMB-1) TaxID=342108 RepID=Q2W7I2_PARM1|nr:flagellar hook-basal body complex protein [Paramagnetospirillum magneticum]BAE50193.1 Flagellar hook protein FlgE [Paramagnetospirillum magneticum AMB-1]